MSFDPDHVSTVTLDPYSTLMDVDAVEKALVERVGGPEPASKLWRSWSLEYTFVGNHVDEHEPFYEVNRAMLQYALETHDVSISASERDAILSVYHELDVFDGVRNAVGRLRDAGYDYYVISNGNPEMPDSTVDHVNIRDLLDGVASADEIGVFKPDAEIYRHTAARAGTPIDEIAHATTGWFDMMGMQHAGMQGVWVDRKASPWDPLGSESNLTVPDFMTFVEALAGDGPSAAD